MTDNNFQARLPRSLSVLETWGFGLTGLMLWVLVAGGMYVELGGPQSVLVWLPVLLAGIMGNLQVRHLGTFWPEMAGGTPNYCARLWRDYPWIARYAVMSYFQNWASVPALSAILLADLLKYHLDSLGLAVPTLPLYILLMSLIFVVAFSGARILGTLNLVFVLPSVGLLLVLVLYGMGWLAWAPASPGIGQGDWSGFKLLAWAKWYFIATCTAYSTETVSSFIADSRKPGESLKLLSGIVGLMPIVMLGGSWVLMRTLAGQQLNTEFPVSNMITATGAFWGGAAPFLATFLIAAGCLLRCVTCAGVSPRVLYQAALDGQAAEVFGVSSHRGTLGPALIMTVLTSLVFLIWQSFQAVFRDHGHGLVCQLHPDAPRHVGAARQPGGPLANRVACDSLGGNRHFYDRRHELGVGTFS